MIIYLKAPDEDTLLSAMPFLQSAVDNEGTTQIITNTHGYDLEIMGPGQVYEAAEPVIDGEDTSELILAEVNGTLYKITEVSQNWHANLRLRDLSLADQVNQIYTVTPSTIQRKFA